MTSIFIGGNMKKIVATSLVLLPILAQAQSANLGRTFSRRITSPVVRRLPQVANQLSVSSAEIKEQEAEFQANLNEALKYLNKNPSKVKAHFKSKDFNKLKGMIQKKQFTKVKSLQKPILRRLPGSGHMKTNFQDPVTSMAELGASLRAQKSNKNLSSVYKLAYKLIDKKDQKKFKQPLKIKNNPYLINGELKKIISGLKLKKLKLVPVLNTGFKSDCTNEIGYQKISDGDGAVRCSNSEFHADSLYKNSSFPLKYYHTCIKQQGARGTCVAFAITAAVESMLMVKEKKSYNLSEQFAYFYGEIYSNHSNRYSYGLNTQNAIKKMDKVNMKFQYENRWEYNPSWDMEDKSGKIHPDSCDGYDAEMCTNYAFQSKEEINGIWPFQNFTYKVPSMSTSKNIQIYDYSNIWNVFAKRNSLDMAIALTNAKTPVIVSFDVKDNFYNAPSSGYVYHESNQDHIGGHASVILGFVANSDLPSGVQHADEEGFFIVKNSWGKGNGDCGYYYVDYKYFRKHARGLYTLTLNI
jgi:C1A family cysteine protease